MLTFVTRFFVLFQNDIVTLNPLRKKSMRMSLQSVLSPIRDTSGLDDLDGFEGERNN